LRPAILRNRPDSTALQAVPVRGFALCAVDPERTRVLRNFRFDYMHHPVNCSSYPWWDRYVMRSHTKINCDANMWNQVEALIRSKLPAPPSSLGGAVSFAPFWKAVC